MCGRVPARSGPTVIQQPASSGPRGRASCGESSEDAPGPLSWEYRQEGQAWPGDRAVSSGPWYQWQCLRRVRGRRPTAGGAARGSPGSRLLHAPHLPSLPQRGGLWGRRTQALTAAKGSSRGVSRGSGDGHRMAVGGIVLRRRETGKAWFHSHSTPGEEGGQGGRGLAAGLHHSWQLCQ